MECAVFAIVGVVVGAALTLIAKVDFVRLAKPWPRKKRVEQAEEAALPGQAKTEEQLMRQWENLLCYSGGDGDEVCL